MEGSTPNTALLPPPEPPRLDPAAMVRRVIDTLEQASFRLASHCDLDMDAEGLRLRYELAAARDLLHDLLRHVG